VVDENDRMCVAPGIHCSVCDYDLRTLSTTGRCPECGASIAESIRHSRARVPWSAADYLIFAVLVACVVGLLWRIFTYSLLYFGHAVYIPVALLGALCHGYLCVRFRPLGAAPGKRLTRMIPLLVVLVLLWAVLMVADELELQWYYWSGGRPY
jgi:hypothetical protein